MLGWRKEWNVTEDLIGYDKLMQDALRSVVRASLQRVAGTNSGLPGRHHFYISFRTGAPGVAIPTHLAQRYPDEMTIVLEHQFWDLDVQADRFKVILKFGGQPHTVCVPFAALTRFYDPSVRFALQFEQEAVEGVDLEEANEPPPLAAAGAVVSLDSFRKK